MSVHLWNPEATIISQLPNFLGDNFATLLSFTFFLKKPGLVVEPYNPSDGVGRINKMKAFLREGVGSRTTWAVYEASVSK